jgi:hypothetical protein
LRLAAAGDSGRTTSTSGDNEKAAVIASSNVIESGQVYRAARRKLEACTCLA